MRRVNRLAIFFCAVGAPLSLFVLPATPQIMPAPQPPKPAPTDSNFAIMPGQGIGDLKLGMHRDEIERLLGPAKQSNSRRPDGNVFMGWFEGNRGLWVLLSSRGEAILIGVQLDSRYTVQGLHIGSIESEVRAALGEPSRVELTPWKSGAAEKNKVLYYDSPGLRIVISNSPQYATNGLVVDISVRRPGCVFQGTPPMLQSGTCR